MQAICCVTIVYLDWVADCIGVRVAAENTVTMLVSPLNSALNSTCVSLICNQIRKWLVLIGYSYFIQTFLQFPREISDWYYSDSFFSFYSLSLSLPLFKLCIDWKNPPQKTHTTIINSAMHMSAVTHQAWKAEKRATFVPNAEWIEMRWSNM